MWVGLLFASACDTAAEPAGIATPPDADGDGVPDASDVCPGFDDTLDADDDQVPDGCDTCADFDDALDGDGDGVADGCDQCPSFDDIIDTDEDSVADGCDACPGFDDTVDTDEDSVADGCDACPNFDDTVDTDEDSVADGCDVCPGFDDAVDENQDGVPDGCEPQGPICDDVIGSWQSTEELECGLGPTGIELCFWTIQFDFDGDFEWAYSDILQTGKWTCNGILGLEGTWPNGSVSGELTSPTTLTWDGVDYEVAP